MVRFRVHTHVVPVGREDVYKRQDQGDFKSSIRHMAEAKTLDPQKYGEQVNVLSVLSYHLSLIHI